PCSPRFPSLGPTLASLAFRGQSAFTASLHVAASGGFTTILNPRQIQAFAPWQDALWVIGRHFLMSAFPRMMSALPPKADMCGAMDHVRFGPKADINDMPGCYCERARRFRVCLCSADPAT